MRKIFTIARREFSAMVATKAFLFSASIMPILMFGAMVVTNMLRDVSEAKDKTIVVIDHTGGSVFARLQAAARVYNRSVEQARAVQVEDNRGQDRSPSPSSKYLLQLNDSVAFTDQDRLALSARVRQGELSAFLEIPREVLETNSDENPKVMLHSQESVLSETRRWLGGELGDAVMSLRLETLGIDPQTVRTARTPVRVVSASLFEETADGKIKSAGEKDDMMSLFVPFGIMMLMFMVIFMAAQPMLESVLEEKIERISEVLLGSVTPFQLMLGKLLGNVAGSLCIFLVYFVGGYGLATYKGWASLIPLELAPWFVAYQILAVMFFSSIFMAVGASVNQLKEAQSLLLPVWLLLVSPMFVWVNAIREPTGQIATWMSFFPPATPMMMILRLSTEKPIPPWQPFAGLLLLLVATLLCLFVAGRVFRIGILWQGKTPRLGEVFRWAISG